MTRLRTLATFAAIACVTLAGAPAALALSAADPAAQRIEAFDTTLLETMKAGPALGAKGRFRKLAPVVEQTFDIPVMTAFAVGPTFARMDAGDKQALIHAFARLSAASYAHNFDAFGGERFEVNSKVQVRGADKIVSSRILPSRGEPTSLTYRMRQTPDGWKIIDVYYGAISQLTTRRSDFAGPLAAGGAKGLLAHLEALTAKLVG